MALLASGLLDVGTKGGGMSVTFWLFSKHTMFFVLFLFLLHFRSSSFDFSPPLTRSLHPLFVLQSVSFLSSVSTLFSSLCLLLQGDCRTREEALILGVELCDNGFMHHGTALFTAEDFSSPKKKKKSSDHAVHKLWNPLHRWLNENWMLWRNCAEGVWHLASCFRTSPLLFSFHFYL